MSVEKEKISGDFVRRLTVVMQGFIAIWHMLFLSFSF